MLSSRATGSGDVTIYLLHFLGSSQNEWQQVAGLLSDRFRCVTIDLPGFGDSAAIHAFTVREMRDTVTQRILADSPADWLLVGHSMGAKVTAAIARQAQDGDAALSGLKGLVMMAGSPPSPEPIPDDRRADMKGWFADDAATSRAQASTFIDNNSALPMDATSKAQAVNDVLRMNRAAWLAWLDAGSREDWSKPVGVLTIPTLILAGEKDPDLGTEAQRTLMLPHFSRAELKTIQGAKHLLPLEAPQAIAALIAQHAASVVNENGIGYQALIESDRVSAATRKVLLDRKSVEVAGYEPAVLSPEELNLMRAIIDSMLPQAESDRIDIAQYIDTQLQGAGDGWRFAKLPRDQEAYRSALQTLELHAQQNRGKPFVALGEEDRDAILLLAMDGKLIAASAALPLTSEQLQLWLLDLRADAARAYMAHPSTLARIGYSGIADGGDSKTMQGFVEIGPGESEPWEPKAKADTP